MILNMANKSEKHLNRTDIEEFLKELGRNDYISFINPSGSGWLINDVLSHNDLVTSKVT